MKAWPTYNYVLIEISKEDQKTESGLVIQEAKQEAPSVGKVVEVGESVKEENTRIIPGAKVMFKRFGGDEVDLEDGKRYVVIESDQIMLVIEKK